MKYIVRKLSLFVLCLTFVSITANALPYKGKITKKAVVKAELERCRRAQGSAELSVNNVRARINQGGNMWYDGSAAHYFVPKDGNSTAMYCAALWIGGQDENKQLRVAALKFGQSGDDFWPGPLTVDGNASVNKAVCDKWDKLYRVRKADVFAFYSKLDKDTGLPTKEALDVLNSPQGDAIREWPGNGDRSLGQSRFLAPFFDRGGDGKYDPYDGDYPYYDFTGELCPATKLAQNPGQAYVPDVTMESDTINPNYGTGGKIKAVGGLLVDQVLKGDETIWWVFNDKGNAHTESGSENPIGLEIRAQAFAFTMNNEINNMTFYSYEIINRSTFTLTNTYFSQWVDPDLGFAKDDFVGCDVERGLGYCYNGKADDGPGDGQYAGIPPAVGIDFFQGPYMDPDGLDNPKVDTNAVIADGKGADLDQYRDENGKINVILLTSDAKKFKKYWYPLVGAEKDPNGACAINGVNFGNGIVDDERFGMRRFVYYNNDDENNGEPAKASDYYNYLRGIWKDNKRMRFGGNGYNKGVKEDIVADFMFPGTSDIWGWGTSTGGNEEVGKTTPWSETTAGNTPADRRFMQSAGPFTLRPGAINYITVGIPWAKATTGGHLASVELLRTIDDKCQALFDNCFNILEGPDAPDVVVQELDREVILYLTNEESSNNYKESYGKVGTTGRDSSIPDEYDNVVTKYDTLHLADGSTEIRSRDSIYKVPYTDEQRRYIFEGYQIFQLKDATVSVADIYDNDKARLVAQCDIKNFDEAGQPIARLVNYVSDESGSFKSQTMVEGANAGIKHTFRITEDMFAQTTDKRIVNNKKYYYIAVAYAYNNFKSYDPKDATKVDGQLTTYLASRKKGDGSNIEPIVVIPHDNKAEQNGTLVQTSYGVCPEIMRIEGNGNGGMVLNLSNESITSLFPDSTGMNTVNFIQTPVYKTNYGPLNVSIVDPLNVKAGNYHIRIVPNENGSTNISDCYWVLKNADETQPLYVTASGERVDSIMSERPIGDINEQIIFELGISISIANVEDIANPIGNQISTKPNIANINNRLNTGVLLSSAIVYDNSDLAWLSGFADADGTTATNWIRSGSSLPSGTTEHDTLSDYYYVEESGNKNKMAIDPTSQFESCVGGTWSPYKLASMLDNHPAFCRGLYMGAGDTYMTDYFEATKTLSLVFNDFNNLASVDIVLTSDTTKWTRCPVIEMCSDPTSSEGKVRKFSLREHSSVFANGKEGDTMHVTRTVGSNTVTDTIRKGMGWFPGYAVNLETGERLNMIFGENSYYGQLNGRDMMWNPVAQGYGSSFGGMHYVYVLGTSQFRFKQSDTDIITVKPPRYDEGRWAYSILSKLSKVSSLEDDADILDDVEALFASVMWVGMPYTNIFPYGSVGLDPSEKNPMLIPTDATIQIRVRKPYKINWSDCNYSDAMPYRATAPQNNNYPMYQFSIEQNMATLVGDKSVASTAMDNISVVPNPYFAADSYERDQIENLVKITNLPPDCYITIYSVDGTVVRKLRGPSSSLVSGGGTALTSVDWDLKNERGLQISGGVYLIHIKADGIGERLVKWFGALRPVDLNSFQ